jgi:hypothetical protein
MYTKSQTQATSKETIRKLKEENEVGTQKEVI